jgi:hypothetical protein
MPPTGPDAVLIQNAARIHSLVVRQTGFTYVNALTWAGVTKELAETRAYQDRLRYQIECFVQDEGPVIIDNSDDGKVERLQAILGLMPGDPGLAVAAKLIGWTDDDLYSRNSNTGKKQPSKLYARVERWRKKREEECRSGCSCNSSPTCSFSSS